MEVYRGHGGKDTRSPKFGLDLDENTFPLKYITIDAQCFVPLHIPDYRQMIQGIKWAGHVARNLKMVNQWLTN
jgi:hypothetical protein